LLVPELRSRGIYAEIPDEEKDEEWTAREKVYGKGQKGLRDDHEGAKYRYGVYEDTVEKEDAKANGSNAVGDEVAGDERPAKRQKR
jgi:hypothetical protein